MQKILILLLLITAFFVAITTIPAQKSNAHFNADTDKDGRISQEEWQRWQNNQFNKYDNNKDGFLSSTESKKLPAGIIGGLNKNLKEESRKRKFNDIDGNKDGVISRLEWRGNEETFNSVDSDGDGTLSQKEYLETGYHFTF